MRAIQFVETASSRQQAADMVHFLGRQDGCIAARVIGDGICKPFAAQALFSIEGEEPSWLPDGCRVVLAIGIPLACEI